MVPLPSNGGITMLFDPRPKDKREDLFDREEEINMIKKYAERYPATLLLGIRRIGKSSILRVALNEIENGIYIDVRKLHFESGGWITIPSLHSNFEKALNSLKPPIKRKVFESLKKINGVSFAGINIRFEKEARISDILESLDDIGGVVIGLDEAQYLRFFGRRGGKEFLSLISYAYDNLKNINFIFTGSEVGLLHDFLGIMDYDSPLYGRVYGEITIEPFKPALSKKFLDAGFEEGDVKVKDAEIDRAIGFLSGIPGWLVEFGYNYLTTRDFDKAMNGVIQKAEKFIEGEIGELEKRSKRYILILRAISMDFNRWGKIKEFVEGNDREIPNSRLASLIRNLEKMSWIKSIEGRYGIIDPVVERILKEK